MDATGHNVITSKIYLSTCVCQMRQREVLPYSVMLVDGAPMNRVSILRRRI